MSTELQDRITSLRKQLQEAEAEFKKNTRVIYKSLRGREYTEHDDIEKVELAKRADDQEKELAKAKLINKRNEFIKRAEKEYGHLPGDTSVVATMLECIEQISDNDIRKKAHEVLKSSNASMELITKEYGTGHEVVKASTKKEAAAQLDTLTDKRVKVTKEDRATAYMAVADDNPELYEKAIGSTTSS